MRPEFGERCAAQNNGAHQVDKIRGRQHGANRPENPRHRLAWKNKAREENRRQNQRHCHLQRLHLVFCLCRNQQAHTQQRERVEQRRNKQREDAPHDRHVENPAHDRKQHRGHDHSDAEVGNNFSEHQTPARERADQQVLQGATLPFAHELHCRGERRRDLQYDPYHAGHKKVGAAQSRVVKNLRPDFDGHRGSPGLFQEQAHRLPQGDGERRVQRLQGDGRTGAVDQHLDLGGSSRMQITREVRRNLHADIRFAFAHQLHHFAQALSVMHDAKRLRVFKTVDQLPRLDGFTLVENNRRHVLDVIIQRVAERDHFDEQREKHEENRDRIAQHHDELLVKNGGESSEGRFHNFPFVIIIVISILLRHAW